MDLGAFAEEVLDAVANICGDRVVESHTQAAHVLDALMRRPGAVRRELAAVFGLSLEQLERGRAPGGLEETNDPVYADLCYSDAVYTWNVLMERINQAAHWREEFRDLRDVEAPSDSEASDVEDTSSSAINPTEACVSADSAGFGAESKGEGIAPDASSMEDVEVGSVEGSSKFVRAGDSTRARAREVLAKRLDAPELLKRRLARRLEEEIFEAFPEDKDYRHCTRSVTANLRRNTMLAAGYTAGRVPPQWMVRADVEALAPRLAQLRRRVFRNESLRESQMDDESAEVKRRAWAAARGEGLAPPPEDKGPLS